MKITKKINDSAKGRMERSFGRIANMLGEKGQGLVDELRGLFDEIEGVEEEISIEDLKAQIEEVVKSYGATEEIANAVAKLSEQVATIKNGLNTNVKTMNLNKDVKNELFSAIFNSANRKQAVEALKEVAVKNEITGITFNDVIDYEIKENWGDQQTFFDKLGKTQVTKFFYNEDDLTEANILAKQWDKESESAKAVQQIELTGKQVAVDYIYKRQRIANSDLDAIKASGNLNSFVGGVTAELRKQVKNTIVKTILVGDTTNAVGSRVTTFEVIGTKNADDIFTTVKNPESGTIEFGDVWKMVRAIKNPNGKDITLFIDPSVLEAISEFKYASGGTSDFRGIDELKVKLGVADIVVYDLHTYSSNQIHAIALIADEYKVVERNEIEVAYPNYEFNQQNWQYEKNCGGAIFGLKSTAVLKEPNA